MKYPYIGEDKDNGNITLFTNENTGVVVENKAFELGSCSNHWAEFAFKNITAEYLANTYGEVKSKEHAHFIVELGEGAGYELVGSISPNNAGVFVFYGENKALFFMLGGGSLHGGSVLKKITIPLPPECERVDEWPKVGDDAILTNENDYEITHGTEAIGEKVKVMSLFKDGDLDMAAIKHDITNYCFRVDMLQKPKTPEQELRDELISCFGKIGQNGIVLIGRYDEVADEFLSKYNVTKKPQ